MPSLSVSFREIPDPDRQSQLEVAGGSRAATNPEPTRHRRAEIAMARVELRNLSAEIDGILLEGDRALAVDYLKFRF